jgi:hypothetical protein
MYKKSPVLGAAYFVISKRKLIFGLPGLFNHCRDVACNVSTRALFAHTADYNPNCPFAVFGGCFSLEKIQQLPEFSRNFQLIPINSSET